MLEIPVNFKNSIIIKSSIDKVFSLLNNFQKSAKNVPKLKEFKKIKEDHYKWEFEPVGTGGFAISAKYETKFKTVKDKEVSWESIPNSGNTDVKGKFSLKKVKDGTQLDLDIDLVAHLPIPRLSKFLAKPIVEAEAKRTMTGYMENIKKTLEG